MKAISLINMKGGVGKTTMAVNIADCLSRRYGKRVLLVDVDPQYNATQCLMKAEDYYEYKISNKDTIIEIFERESHLEVSVVEGNIDKEPNAIDEIVPFSVSEKFDLIPGALDLYKIEMSAGEGKEFGIKQYLATVEEKYDYVIIDTPPTPSVWMTSALLASDFYLIPTKADPISLTGIDLLYTIIETKTRRYGLSGLKCCGVVITVAERSTINYQNAQANLKANARWKNKLYTYSLCKRVDMAREQLNQKFILDMSDTQIKSDLNNIVKEMLSRIGDDVDE
ncbi:MAG: AAA family ATPase [Lachnospiraceae bacterium]|nr:AAA family ATPase [Lachnospiraceae bacterium]